MSGTHTIPAPPGGFVGRAIYRVRPREKRAFSTVLDAQRVVGGSSRPFSEVSFTSEDGDVVLAMDNPVAEGRMREEFRFGREGDGLVSRRLSREVFDGSGRAVRTEIVPDFRHDALGLPRATYPEVALPFILGWMPHDSARRSVYAWINDRFIAKVYVEVTARTSLSIAGKTHDVVETVMYPDLNDWVPLGAMITRLAKPFLPKYHMWYERRAPHALVRFEGPYGPPGAPEVVLEASTMNA
ncbi:MAG TPA: hypothetical protein VKU41_16985 [Polyangiaceae bacterium]|nr:hypothetical protein [Polyangiaceae bacterium]